MSFRDRSLGSAVRTVRRRGTVQKGRTTDARSKLPDGTEVDGLPRTPKSYLVGDRLDQVAFSFLKHVACYAAGRSLTYSELVFLQSESSRMRSQEISHAGFDQVHREERLVPEEIGIAAVPSRNHRIRLESIPMSARTQLDRRTVLKGLAGVSLTLPILEAMGQEVVRQSPRRFCALYTANGMSLPNPKHGIAEWNWFPTVNQGGKGLRIRQVDRATPPLPRRHQLPGGVQHPNGAKADPHICSDMWLTGAPLQDPKPGTFNRSLSTR